MAEREKWLPETQSAFRKNRGVEDHLFSLMGLIERARIDNTNLILGFIDLEKAYDNVLRNEMWYKLKVMGVSENFIQILQSLYKDHMRRANVAGGTTDWVICKKGLRQGCPLSALLFVLLLARFPELIAQYAKGIDVMGMKVHMLLFADDRRTL